MLNLFRSLTKTWFGRILGVFLIIGLAGFGISNVIGTLGTNTIASAAGTDISTRDFQRAYQTQLNAFAQQNGRLPSSEEALAAGIPGFTLQQLASQASVNKFARDLGLGVSETKLADMVRTDPNFSGTLGNFSSDNFKAVLQNSGFTEKEYFDLQRDAARRQQLLAGLTGDSPTPNAALELVTRYAGDKRTVDYFVLNATSLPPVAEPTEDDLAAYLKDHQAEFRTLETRTVDVLVLTPDTLAATKTIAEDQIAAEYDRTKDSRVTPEKRAIKQVALATPELEKAFTDGKAAGTPVSQIVTASAATASDLGLRTKAEVTDASLAEAAFALASTDDVVIIDGIGGTKRAIFVSEIQPTHQVTLEEARDEIARKLATDAARTEIADMLDQIEELRAAFKQLPEIAERFGLKIANLKVTAGGAELADNADIPEDARANVAAAIFKAEQGALTPAVSLGSNRNIWFDLKAVEPARDQTLAEVRDAIVAAWTAQKTSEALTTEVAITLDKLRAGVPFADAAAALNQFPVLSQPLTRNGDGTPVLNQAVASAIFDGGPDHFGAAQNGDGDQVIFRVVEITPAETTEAAANVKTFVQNSMTDALDADFQRGLLDAAGLKVNQQALMSLLGLNTTAQ
jgi:peptidyl-prolyl cis-trans isomerase D